jgi:hypothetical protein
MKVESWKAENRILKGCCEQTADPSTPLRFAQDHTFETLHEVAPKN